MSSCPKCGTTFKYRDWFFDFMPNDVKCGECNGRIKSSNLIAIPTIIIFVIVAFAFLPDPLPFDAISWIVRVSILLVFATIIDYIYYYLLAKGIIESNLVIEKQPKKL